MHRETTRSRPHRLMEEVLRVRFVAQESEYEGFPPYQLDIYLPEVHCALEIDGPTHTTYSAKDRERDTVLREKYGVETLRIKTSRLASAATLHEVWLDVLAFMKMHGPTTDVRKRKRNGTDS